jgi:hypothetical protein
MVFLLSAAVAIGLFFIPSFIIRPFRQQTPSMLALAMALRQRAPWGTLVAGLTCLVVVLILWRAQTVWRKIVLGLIFSFVAFSAIMSRVNYFEWMFHPVDNPQFESESASKLDKGEMILAVNFVGDARAYPIREMAYHHVLNDVVAGVPIAVTY